MVVLALGALDFGLEQSIVLPALPRLREHYDASLTATGWLATGFLLASVVAVPLLGRLGDLYGRRLLLLVSLAAFALGSLLCAVAEGIELAIAGRVLQGVGAAVGPLTLGIARDVFRPELVPRAIGAVVGASSVGSAIGYLLSGTLDEAFGPTSIFWFLVVVAVVIGIAVILTVPAGGSRASAPLDLPGAALLGGGLALLLLGIAKGRDWDWTSGTTLGVLGASVLVLLAFAAVERSVAHPLVDLRLLARAPFGVANLCVVPLGFAFFLAPFVIPIVAATPEASGYGSGLDTTEIGLVLAPTGLLALASSWVAGRLVLRVGPRPVVAAGAVAAVVGYVSLAAAHSGPLALAAGAGIVSLSWGAGLTGVLAIVVRGAPPDTTGIAVGVHVVLRNTAVTVGTQVGFAVITAAGLVGPFPDDSGYRSVFLAGAVGAGLVLLASLALPRRLGAAAASPG